jgi:hypothetical protein
MRQNALSLALCGDVEYNTKRGKWIASIQKLGGHGPGTIAARLMVTAIVLIATITPRH